MTAIMQLRGRGQAAEGRAICDDEVVAVAPSANAPAKNQIETMARPYFSVSKKRMKPILYVDNVSGAIIRITASEYGMATIWDKDVLLYCQGYMLKMIDRGEPVSRRVSFTVHDFLTSTGRCVGGSDYAWLRRALLRLRATTVETTVKTGGVTVVEGFGWIESYKFITRDSGGMSAVEVVLSEWVYRAIAVDKSVLTLDRQYYRLTGGLERRVYELARKHCGNQEKWTVALERFQNLVGCDCSAAEFRRQLRGLGPLPGYTMRLTFDHCSAEARALKADGYDLKSRGWGGRRMSVVIERRSSEEA